MISFPCEEHKRREEVWQNKQKRLWIYVRYLEYRQHWWYFIFMCALFKTGKVLHIHLVFPAEVSANGNGGRKCRKCIQRCPHPDDSLGRQQKTPVHSERLCKLIYVITACDGLTDWLTLQKTQKLHTTDWCRSCIIHTTHIFCNYSSLEGFCFCTYTESTKKSWILTHTFLILLAYCFIAIFSTVLSKPKNDLMSRLAVCSKHVQSSFSGWTWTNTHKHVHYYFI